MDTRKSNQTQKEKILQVRDLKTHFRVGTGKTRIKVKAVDGISFDIYKKDVFGLVGESGCGKTTASRTIIRLYRPTSGEVTFEGQVIGSGNDEFYQNIIRAREEYRINKLQYNSRQKAIYEINQKYEDLFSELDTKEKVLEHKLEEDIKKARQPIGDHKKTLFEAKNNHSLTRERAYFDYINAKNDLYLQTINEDLHEYESIKKNMEKTFKIKYASLDDSVGLDVEARESQKVILKQHHEEELLQLEKEYKDLIENKSLNLLPKQEYKAKLKELTIEHKARKKDIKAEYQAYLASIEAPDRQAISEHVSSLKEAHKLEVAELRLQKQTYLKERSEALKHVPTKAVIDTEKLQTLKEEYKAYIKEQRNSIKESRQKHYNKEAIEKTKHMQMIFQDPISSLNPRMTVGEIVSEGLIINGEKNKEVIKKKVIESLELVGLAPEYISRYPHEFSGGQRQRIGIARALIMNPSFIIADEPISALDVSIRAQVLNLLTRLKDKLELSILFIAHDLSVVKFFCDRIAVMYNGKIVELAPTEEIFKHPLHPYTKSLLSAVPQPDPDSEKTRKRIQYSPYMHDYSVDKPELREVYEGHFVYCNEAELALVKKELGERNA